MFPCATGIGSSADMSRDRHFYEPQDWSDLRLPRSGGGPDSELTAGDPPEQVTVRDHEPELWPSDPQRTVPPRSKASDSERAYFLGNRPYLLRASELDALAQIGTFRLLGAHDLRKYEYADDGVRFEQDISHLKQQSLATDTTIEVSGRKTLRVLTLTRTGRRLLAAAGRLPEDQATYHGLCKPMHAKHDADLYRLYQHEAVRIRRAGGKPVRVILECEFNREVNRDLMRLGPARDDPQAKQRVAEKHGLEVVDGRIPRPDLRIEYLTAQVEIEHVDLELATRHYKPNTISKQARAGFSLYARSEEAVRLRRILRDRNLAAEIVSL